MRASDLSGSAFSLLIFCAAAIAAGALVATRADHAPESGSPGKDLLTWTDLFASGDFSQWQQPNGKPVGPRWTIVDGVVHRERLGAGDIVTRAHYKNFELRFEWKISEAGNSGIKYRTRGKLGLEYQILDDARHRDAQTPSRRAASLYDLVAAAGDKALRPAGSWNSGQIIVEDSHLEHWLNAQQVLSIEIGSEDWVQRLESSKYSKHHDFGTWVGPLILQDHFDKVWYRNVRIRRI